MLRSHFSDNQEEKSNEDEKTVVLSDSTLIPVSVDLLYDGMLVQDDIFDANCSKLLIGAGNEISAFQVDNVRRLNSGRDTIYVSARTRTTMVTKRPNIEIDSRSRVEKEVGYAEVTNETLTILEDIANNKTVDQEALQDVSQELSERLELTSPDVILSIINAMAPVDEYLQRHSTNVGLLNGLIGRWMGLPKDFVDSLVLTGLLHDCGKAMLPSKLLNAPRALSVVEFEVLKTHAVHTHELLADFPGTIRYAASSHHERLDGSGYPKKFRDIEIMAEARITAVSDIYDAMVSQRSYKKPQSPFSIMALLKKMSRKELDSDVVRVFIDNMPGELINKPVMMSDGTIAILRDYDDSDIEYPIVEIDSRILKTHEDLYVVSMFNDE